MDAVKTGLLISGVRKENEMTQGDVAQALHVSIQAVSKWERGLNFPDISLLEPLAGLLGLTVSELLAGERGGQPQEALVRESLRVSLSQLGGRVKRWRVLFWVALALLLALVLGGGYCYIRDHTQLLPQRQTEISRRDISEVEFLSAQSLGTSLAFFDVTVADSLDAFFGRLELWTHEGLLQSWELGKMSGFQEVGIQRRQLLVCSWQVDLEAEPASLTTGLTFGGATWRCTLTDIPYLSRGIFARALDGEIVADSEDGTVLVCLSLDAGQGGWRTPSHTGNVESLSPAEGEAFLLLRVFCT